MTQYYGVTHSGESLSHYGIKGMKWGVRKAINNRDYQALNRQYRKAYKKLQKLNAKANIRFQNENAKKHASRAALGLGVGALGIGIRNWNNNLAKANLKKEVNKIISDPNKASDAYNMLVNTKPNSGTKPRSRVKKVVSGGTGLGKKNASWQLQQIQQAMGGSDYIPQWMSQPKQDAYIHPSFVSNNITNAAQSTTRKLNPYKIADVIGKGMIVGGLGTAAYQTGRAAVAKYRTTKKGHAKAVAKRNAWENEMQKAFRGTSYSKALNHKKKRRR